MTTETTWLLDVDGVLNVLADNRRDNVNLRKAYASSGGVRYLLCWRPRLLDDIRRATRCVDARWATTWCEDPDALEAAVGIRLPRAFGKRPPNLTHDELKIGAARDVLKAGRRLIWTDDTVVPVARRLYPAFAEAEAQGRALLIAPDERRGLTNRHVADIKTFARLGQEEKFPRPLTSARA